MPRRRLGQAHGRADREHSVPWRRRARLRRRHSNRRQERPSRRSGNEGRAQVRCKGRRDRRAAPARSRHDGGRHRTRGREGGQGYADLRDRLHHAARGTARPAEIPRRRARSRRDDRAIAEQVRHDPQVVRLPALRRILDVSARGPGIADDVRSVARAGRQSHDARLGLRAVSTRRRPQLGRHEASLREADACHMENFVDNVAGNVVAYHSDSPVDMERTSSSFRRGDLHGIASDDVPIRRASSDARLGRERRAGLRAPVARRAFPTSRRRRVRRRTRGRAYARSRT